MGRNKSEKVNSIGMTGTHDVDKTDITCKDTQYGWGQYKLKFKDIQSLDQLRFDLKITIIDMFDASGNIIHPNSYSQVIQYPLCKQYPMVENVFCVCEQG
eukprot:533453_1